MSTDSCRFCLKTLDIQGRGTFIWEKSFRLAVARVFRFEIKSNNDLPAFACNKCSSMVRDFDTFSVQVEENQKRLLGVHIGDAVQESSITGAHDEPPSTLNNSSQPDRTVATGTAHVECKTEMDEVKVSLEYNPDLENRCPEAESPQVSEQNNAKEREETSSSIVKQEEDDVETDDEFLQNFKARWDGNKLLQEGALHDVEELRANFKEIPKTKHVVQKYTTAAMFNDFAADLEDDMIDIEESNRLLIKEENDTELPDDDMTESNEDSSNTSDEQTLNCDQCDKEFENRAQLIKHRRVHRKKQCPVCFKSISVNNFKAHVAAHKGSFSCDVCAKSFASKHSLNEHKNVIHGSKQSNDQKLQCDQCEKVCASKTQLTNHLRIHNVKQCPVCYKSVPIPSFKRHVAVHSGAFLCDVCSKSFTRKKTLDEHKLIKHGSTVVNDGKLKCDQCDKVCVTKVQLMNHQRVHQLKKCPICSKSIPVNNLPVHVKAHTPCFSCDICDKSFTRKSSLNDHKKTQHATNIPESHKLHCDVCEKVCLTKIQLMKHQRLHRDK